MSVVHFTVDGEGLTNIVRNLLLSEDPGRAWRVLARGLVGEGSERDDHASARRAQAISRGVVGDPDPVRGPNQDSLLTRRGMKTYAQREVFTEQDLQIFERATQMVDRLDGDGWRCHEVSRVVQKALQVEGHETCVADGHYGAIEHSWLWIPPLFRQVILEVYAVGALPPVQLVHRTVGTGSLYSVAPEPRTDIDENRVRWGVNDALTDGTVCGLIKVGLIEAQK